MKIGNSKANEKELKMTVAQFYAKKEQLRERIVSEIKRLKLSMTQICSVFDTLKKSNKGLPLAAFKRRMMDIGFSLSDYPDEALQVLDLDNDGTISPSEFVGFVEEGLRHEEANLTVPQEIKPIDDLMFKRANLEGVITAKVASGRRGIERTTKGNFDNKNPNTPGNASKLPHGASFASPIAPTPRSLGHQSFDFHNETATMKSAVSENTRRMFSEVGLKLHSDALLRKAEEGRTRSLTVLKKAFQQRKKESVAAGTSTGEQASTATEGLDDGILRKRQVVKKIKNRDILKDRDAMILLNYKVDQLTTINTEVANGTAKNTGRDEDSLNPSVRGRSFQDVEAFGENRHSEEPPRSVRYRVDCPT
eukprot:gene22447-23612_t